MRHLSYANITSTLALVLALGGTAYAAATITGADVVNNSLTGQDIKDGKVKSADVAGLSVNDFALNGLPGARMENGQTGLSAPNGSLLAFDMDVEAYDTGNMYTAPDDVITINKAGTYLVSASVNWGEGDEVLRLRVIVNGSSAYAAVSAANMPGAHTQQLVTLLRFESGDEISLGTGTATGPVTITDVNGINDVWLAAQMVSR